MAGAAYDISPSTANATAQSGQISADTTINFGAGSSFKEEKSQVANPSATASAAKQNTGAVGSDQPSQADNQKKLLLYGGIAVVSIIGVIVIVMLIKKK